jgi:hypothetical protein
MNKSRRAASVLGLFLYNGAVYAADPPTFPFDDVDWNARVPQRHVGGVTMGMLKVLFEKTFLSDWNVKASGAGFVTRFAVNAGYLSQFGVQKVWRIDRI